MPSLSSCTNLPPLVTLDPIGKASILNYNLPQETCLNATGYVALRFDESRANTPPIPDDNFWDTIVIKTPDEIRMLLVQELNLAISREEKVLFNNSLIKHHATVKVVNSSTGSNLRSISVDEDPKNILIAGVRMDSVIHNITQGFRPILQYDLYGEPMLSYLPPPAQQPKYRLILALHYRMCSYLGDYGAGKTIKTFSLLPGERTTITIRDYVHNELVSEKAENILDSFSVASTSSLQIIVSSSENHLNSSDQVDSAVQSGNWEAGIGIGLNLGISENFGINIGAGGGGGGTGTESESLNVVIAEQTENLTNSVTNHVTQTNGVRDIEVRHLYYCNQH